jgi:hypothetical protein
MWPELFGPIQKRLFWIKEEEDKRLIKIPAGNTQVDLRHFVTPVAFSAPNLLHVYHLWLGGTWEAILHEHLDALIFSGLLEQLRFVCVGFVGEPQDITRAKTIFIERNVPFITLTCCSKGFEQETMCKIQKLISKRPDDTCVLYAHDKGAFAGSRGRQSWRRAMTKHNIFEWQECLKLLEGADAVGIHLLSHECYPRSYHKDAAPSFGGTFWWAKVKHLKTLGPLRYDSRFDAEHWIGQREDVQKHGKMKLINKYGNWPLYV